MQEVKLIGHIEPSGYTTLKLYDSDSNKITEIGSGNAKMAFEIACDYINGKFHDKPNTHKLEDDK